MVNADYGSYKKVHIALGQVDEIYSQNVEKNIQNILQKVNPKKDFHFNHNKGNRQNSRNNYKLQAMAQNFHPKPDLSRPPPMIVMYQNQNPSNHPLN